MFGHACHTANSERQIAHCENRFVHFGTHSISIDDRCQRLMGVMSSRSNVKQRHVCRIEVFVGGKIGEVMFPENTSILSENAEDLEIEWEDVSSSFALAEQYLPFRRM